MILKQSFNALIFRGDQSWPCVVTGLNLDVGYGGRLATVEMETDVYSATGGEHPEYARAVLIKSYTGSIQPIDAPETLELSGYTSNMLGDTKHYNKVIIKTDSLQWHEE